MSLNTARMVPAGKNAFIKEFDASVTGAKAVEIRLRATSIDTTLLPNIFIFKDTLEAYSGGVPKIYDVPIIVPPLAIIKCTAWSEYTGTTVSARWAGWLKTI